MRNAILTSFFLLVFLASPVSAQTMTPPPTALPTPTTTATEFPIPSCTPPPCPADGQLVCGIEGGCPGGCGTVCILPPTQPVTIPEPLTILLFGAGIAGLGSYIVKRRQ